MSRRTTFRSAFLLIALSGALSLGKAVEPLTIQGSVVGGPATEGATTQIDFRLTNRSGTEATGVSFSLDLPDGFVLGDPAFIGSTCPVGTGAGNPGETNFSFSGGTVPARGSCSVSIQVVAAAAGNYPFETSEVTSNLETACAASFLFQVENANALLGSALEATVDGTSVTFDLRLTNLDTEDIADLSARLNLVAAFGERGSSPGPTLPNYRITEPPVLVDDPGTFQLNPTFNGDSDTELIRRSTGNDRESDDSSLGVGASARIQFTVEITNGVDLGSGVGNYSAQASVSGMTTTSLTTDLSQEGTEP
ncbi:MAG: hypothetical protein AAGC68_08520, partial [Verrucomicrobiota bacterium]